MAEDQTDKTQVSRRATEEYGALRPGALIGRYEIVSVLGQGSFGITYRARDTQLDRDVAIKEYLPSALAVRQQHDAMFFPLEVLFGEPLARERRLRRPPRFDFVLVQQPQRYRIIAVGVHKNRSLNAGNRAWNVLHHKRFCGAIYG